MDKFISLDLNKETKEKLFAIAIKILEMHGQSVGDRCCQDWSDDEVNPDEMFTNEEKRLLRYNYEIANSDLEDYDDSFVNLDDEMLTSFVVAENLRLLVSKEW